MIEISNVIYDQKLGEIVNAKYRSSQKSSSNFIQYLYDYKKGKFKSADDIIISNLKEGGVISSITALSQSNVPSSIILNPFSNLPFHDNSDAMGVSVKSGVIITSNSPFAS